MHELGRVRKPGMLAHPPLRYTIRGQTPVSHRHLRIGREGRFPRSKEVVYFAVQKPFFIANRV